MREDQGRLGEEVDPEAAGLIRTEQATLVPADIADLFLRPTKFFSGRLALGKTPYLVPVIIVYGLAEALDRVSQEMTRGELTDPRPYWETLGPLVTDSWMGFWAVSLLWGAISGVSLWYLGGWWYRIRLGWAGASDPDRRQARLVYIYSGFVWAAPVVAVAIIQTLTYANYQQAWESEEIFPLVVLVFPFWSVVVSYYGARALFDMSVWRGRVWFFILPMLGLVIGYGLLVGALAWLDAVGATGAA